MFPWCFRGVTSARPHEMVAKHTARREGGMHPSGRTGVRLWRGVSCRVCSNHDRKGSTENVSSDHISIRGAREHNLCGFDLEIPRDKLVVITGLSGSGKSSLAFDTIYAEGQRRYVESLSAYARQFLGQMEKPDVDHIEGLSPAVSIDQKTTSRNPRSTVGTVTEIYDYLRLLFARVGIPHCPICGRVIERQTPQQIVDRIMGELADGHAVPGARPGREGPQGRVRQAARGPQEGGLHARARGRRGARRSTRRSPLDKKYKHDIEVVVDRLVMKEGIQSRLTDSRRDGAASRRAAPSSSRPEGRRGAVVLAGLRLSGARRVSMDELAAARLLLQRALRRLPRLHGPGLAARARPRPHRARRLAVARGGRDQALLGRHELLPAADRRRGASTSASPRTRRGATCPRTFATRCCTAWATSASASTTRRATDAQTHWFSR